MCVRVRICVRACACVCVCVRVRAHTQGHLVVLEDGVGEGLDVLRRHGRVSGDGKRVSDGRLSGDGKRISDGWSTTAASATSASAMAVPPSLPPSPPLSLFLSPSLRPSTLRPAAPPPLRPSAPPSSLQSSRHGVVAARDGASPPPREGPPPKGCRRAGRHLPGRAGVPSHPLHGREGRAAADPFCLAHPVGLSRDHSVGAARGELGSMCGAKREKILFVNGCL